MISGASVPEAPLSLSKVTPFSISIRMSLVKRGYVSYAWRKLIVSIRASRKHVVRFQNFALALAFQQLIGRLI